MGNIFNISSKAKHGEEYKKMQDDKFYVVLKYKKRRFRGYLAVAILDSKRYNKKFRHREDAENWLTEIKRHANK